MILAGDQALSHLTLENQYANNLKESADAVIDVDNFDKI